MATTTAANRGRGRGGRSGRGRGGSHSIGSIASAPAGHKGTKDRSKSGTVGGPTKKSYVFVCAFSVFFILFFVKQRHNTIKKHK